MIMTLLFSRKRHAEKYFRIWVFILILSIGNIASGQFGGISIQHADQGQDDSSSKTLRSMARIYMAYGEYEKAQLILNQALALAKTKDVSDSEHCLCMLDLAWLYKSQGKAVEAEELCKSALKIQKSIYDDQHPYLAYTLRMLGSIYQQQAKYDRSRLVLERAVTIMQECDFPIPVIAPFKIDIAKLFTIQGKLIQAEELYDQTIVQISQAYGKDNIYTAKVLAEIAKLYLLQERYDEAESIIEGSLETQEKVYGFDHYLLTPTLLTQARIYQAKNQYSHAENLLKKILDIATQKHGTEHPFVGKILSAMAELHLMNGDYKKAELLSKQAVEILEDTLGNENDVTAMALNNMAKVYIHREDYPEAQNLCDIALETLEKTLGQDHPKTEQVQKTISLLNRKIGNSSTNQLTAKNNHLLKINMP